MAAPYAYPANTDLESWLTAAGFSYGTLDTTKAVARGIEELERRIGGKARVETNARTRRFDPPGRGSGIFHLDGFLDSASAVTVQLQATGMTAETLTVDEDYRLLPDNAADDTLPYTQLELYRAVALPVLREYRKCILVTGKWGWTGGLTEEAREAVLKLAAASLCGQKGFDLSDGRIQATNAGVQESWGADPLAGVRESWRKDADRVIRSMRVLRL